MKTDETAPLLQYKYIPMKALQAKAHYFGTIILISYKKIDETPDFSTQKLTFCFKHSGVQFWCFMKVIR